jgi:hypothetical protein
LVVPSASADCSVSRPRRRAEVQDADVENKVGQPVGVLAVKFVTGGERETGNVGEDRGAEVNGDMGMFGEGGVLRAER